MLTRNRVEIIWQLRMTAETHGSSRRFNHRIISQRCATFRQTQANWGLLPWALRTALYQRTAYAPGHSSFPRASMRSDQLMLMFMQWAQTGELLRFSRSDSRQEWIHHAHRTIHLPVVQVLRIKNFSLGH